MPAGVDGWKSHYFIAYFTQPQYGIWAGYVNGATKQFASCITYAALTFSNLTSTTVDGYCRVWNAGSAYTHYIYMDQPA